MSKQAIKQATKHISTSPHLGGLGGCVFFIICLFLCSCKNTAKTVTEDDTVQAVGPQFQADSAYVYCQKQCDFGPRVMNSTEHDKCRDWIVSEFKRHGCTVELQQADLKGYDGTMLHSSNIIAHYTPKDTATVPSASPDSATVPSASPDTATVPSASPDNATVPSGSPEGPRLLLCAHYDSRPWADNDPDEANHHKPVMAANDGASGIGVMLELARLVHQADSAHMAIDFVCFDAEDYGTPQWYKGESQVEDPWALGAQYWAQQYAKNPTPAYTFGILLDMVGGEGSVFYEEGMSKKYAQETVNTVWNAASVAGYGSMFNNQEGGYITDDHIPVNEVANIPCIDIIPYYPDCKQSTFGPTWHTVSDTMEHLSKSTLQGVGQTLVQIVYQ